MRGPSGLRKFSSVQFSSMVSTRSRATPNLLRQPQGAADPRSRANHKSCSCTGRHAPRPTLLLRGSSTAQHGKVARDLRAGALGDWTLPAFTNRRSHGYTLAFAGDVGVCTMFHGSSPSLTLSTSCLRSETNTTHQQVLSFASGGESNGQASLQPRILDLGDSSGQTMTLMRSMESVYVKSMTVEDEKNKLLREKVHAEDQARRLQNDCQKLTQQLAQERSRRTSDQTERHCAPPDSCTVASRSRAVLRGSLPRISPAS